MILWPGYAARQADLEPSVAREHTLVVELWLPARTKAVYAVEVLEHPPKSAGAEEVVSFDWTEGVFANPPLVTMLSRAESGVKGAKAAFRSTEHFGNH
jgi:hypothetical protein